MTAMPAAFAAARSDPMKGPSVDSAIAASSAAVWLAGEKAIKNSGKAIKPAPWFLAAAIIARAVSRLAFLSVPDLSWTTAILSIETLLLRRLFRRVTLE